MRGCQAQSTAAVRVCVGVRAVGVPLLAQGPPGSLASIFTWSNSGLVLSQGCGVEVEQWESLGHPSPSHPLFTGAGNG